MKNFRLFVALIAMAAFTFHAPLASAEEKPNVPASMPDKKISVSNENFTAMNKAEIARKEVVFDGGQIVLPAPKPIGIDGGPTPAEIKDKPAPVLIGPPVRVPPFGDYHFPKDLDHSYTKDGQQVTIVSDKNTLTISWTPVQEAWTDKSGDHAPHLDVSTTYSFNLKTGKIMVMTCVEVCRGRELSLRNDGKEYVRALKTMLSKVADAIKIPRLGMKNDDTFRKLHEVSKVLSQIIKIAEKIIGGTGCGPQDLGCDANPVVDEPPAAVTHSAAGRGVMATD